MHFTRFEFAQIIVIFWWDAERKISDFHTVADYIQVDAFFCCPSLRCYNTHTRVLIRCGHWILWRKRHMHICLGIHFILQSRDCNVSAVFFCPEYVEFWSHGNLHELYSCGSVWWEGTILVCLSQSWASFTQSLAIAIQTTTAFTQSAHGSLHHLLLASPRGETSLLLSLRIHILKKFE